MRDSSTSLRNATRHMNKAFHLYRSKEDALTVAKQLIRLQRTLTEARSGLIGEQLEALLAHPTLERTDREILKKLLRLKLSS